MASPHSRIAGNALLWSVILPLTLLNLQWGEAPRLPIMPGAVSAAIVNANAHSPTVVAFQLTPEPTGHDLQHNSRMTQVEKHALAIPKTASKSSKKTNNYTTMALGAAAVAAPGATHDKKTTENDDTNVRNTNMKDASSVLAKKMSKNINTINTDTIAALAANNNNNNSIDAMKKKTRMICKTMTTSIDDTIWKTATSTVREINDFDDDSTANARNTADDDMDMINDDDDEMEMMTTTMNDDGKIIPSVEELLDMMNIIDTTKEEDEDDHTRRSTNDDINEEETKEITWMNMLDMMNITIDNTNTDDGSINKDETKDMDTITATTEEDDDEDSSILSRTLRVPLNKRTMSRKDRRQIRDNERMKKQMMKDETTVEKTDNNKTNTITKIEENDNIGSIQAAWIRTKQRMNERKNTTHDEIRQDISDMFNIMERLEQEVMRYQMHQHQMEMNQQYQLELEVDKYYESERHRQDQLGLEMNRQYHLEIPMGDAWTYNCIMAASTTQLEIPLGDAWIHDSISTTTTPPLKLESQPPEHKANNMCKETINREQLPSTPPRTTKLTQISPKTPFEELSMLRQQYQILPPVFHPRQPPSFITELQFVTSLRQKRKDHFKAVHTALQYACTQHQITARLHHTDRMRSKMRRIQLRPIVQELHGSYALQEPETPEYRSVALTAKRLLKNMPPQPSIHSIKSYYKARLTSLVTSATVPASIAAVTDKTGPSKLIETKEELLDHLRSHEAVTCCPYTGTWLFGDKIEWTPANALLIHKYKRFRMLQTPKRSHPPRWYRHDNRYQILYYYGDIEDIAESIMDLAQRAIEAKVEPPALKPLRKKPRPTRQQLQQRKEANDRRWEAIMNRKFLEPTPDYSEEFALCQQQWFQFGTKRNVDVRLELSTANSDENYYFHRGRPPDSTPRVLPPPTPIPSSGF